MAENPWDVEYRTLREKMLAAAESGNRELAASFAKQIEFQKLERARFGDTTSDPHGQWHGGPETKNGYMQSDYASQYGRDFARQFDAKGLVDYVGNIPAVRSTLDELGRPIVDAAKDWLAPGIEMVTQGPSGVIRGSAARALAGPVSRIGGAGYDASRQMAEDDRTIGIDRGMLGTPYERLKSYLLGSSEQGKKEATAVSRDLFGNQPNQFYSKPPVSSTQATAATGAASAPAIGRQEASSPTIGYDPYTYASPAPATEVATRPDQIDYGSILRSMVVGGSNTTGKAGYTPYELHMENLKKMGIKSPVAETGAMRFRRDRQADRTERRMLKAQTDIASAGVASKAAQARAEEASKRSFAVFQKQNDAMFERAKAEYEAKMLTTAQKQKAKEQSDKTYNMLVSKLPDSLVSRKGDTLIPKNAEVAERLRILAEYNAVSGTEIKSDDEIMRIADWAKEAGLI